MRIGLVTDCLPHESRGGGIGTYTSLVAMELARRSVDTHIFWTNGGADYSSYVNNNITYHKCPSFISFRRHSKVFGAAWVAGRPWTREFGQGLALRFFMEPVVARQRFDAIEFPEYGGWAVAGLRLPGVDNVFVRLHGCSKLCEENSGARQDLRMRGIDHLEAWATRQASGITSPCQANVSLTERAWGNRLGEVRIVPNPISAHAEFRDRDARGPNTVIFTGRLEPRKGIHVLAEAVPQILRHVPDARFKFIGLDTKFPDQRLGSEVVGEILGRAGISEDRIELTGPMSRDRAVGEVSKAMVAVVPSLYENFPMVVLEALACGTPVVASDTGGVSEILRPDGGGLLCVPGDSASLAAQVVRILAGGEGLWERMSSEAYMRSLDFDVASVVDRLLDAWGLVSPGRGEGRVDHGTLGPSELSPVLDGGATS